MKRPRKMRRYCAIVKAPDGARMLCIRKGRCVTSEDCAACDDRPKSKEGA